MKKYIFATIIALTALTACRLDNGSEPDVDAVPRRLYNTMYRAALERCMPYFDIVVFTDMLMDGDATLVEQIKRKFPYEVTVEEGVYRFKTAGYYSYYVIPDDRHLEDGGEWTAGVVSNSDSIPLPQESVTIKGSAGSAGEFTMLFTRETVVVSISKGITSTSITEGEFVLNSEVERDKDAIKVTHYVTTSASYFYDGEIGIYSDSTERYRIEWSSLVPLSIVNGRDQRLAMDIRYTNLDSGTTRHVAAYINGSEQRFERFDE